jgi:hypothetical protein
MALRTTLTSTIAGFAALPAGCANVPVAVSDNTTLSVRLRPSR